MRDQSDIMTVHKISGSLIKSIASQKLMSRWSRKLKVAVMPPGGMYTSRRPMTSSIFSRQLALSMSIYMDEVCGFLKTGPLVHIVLITARRYTSAVYDMARCPYACRPSVHLSHIRPILYQQG